MKMHCIYWLSIKENETEYLTLWPCCKGLFDFSLKAFILLFLTEMDPLWWYQQKMKYLYFSTSCDAQSKTISTTYLQAFVKKMWAYHSCFWEYLDAGDHQSTLLPPFRAWSYFWWYPAYTKSIQVWSWNKANICVVWQLNDLGVQPGLSEPKDP